MNSSPQIKVVLQSTCLCCRIKWRGRGGGGARVRHIGYHGTTAQVCGVSQDPDGRTLNTSDGL